MKIAFLHYHLKPGGVTTVIKHQVAAVKDTCDTLVLASGVPEQDIGTEGIPVPLVAYDKNIKRNFTPGELAEALLKAIKRKWQGGCDVLHVHNPTLAKNRHLLKALEMLRDKGTRLFLQIHDFAEDGRPDVYHGGDYTADVHYGIINSRDRDILLQAGLKKEGLHLIHNKVSPFDIDIEGEACESGDGFVLYPVRAIRRKNIGEALLLSLFLEKGQTVGITLPPNSESDWKSYRLWKTFIHTHGFNRNLALEVGVKGDFFRLVRNARFFITTSLNEGFGFAFLEPWTAGKMVFGRNLPHVCRDFQARGIQLDHLYDVFKIPLNCINKGSFYERWAGSFSRLARAFDYHSDPKQLRQAYEKIIANGVIDFGVLDESAQMETLLHIKESRECARKVRQLNPWLHRFRCAGINPEVIAHNNETVRKHYGSESYRERLLRIYERVISVPVTHRIDKKVVLKAFFDPAEYKMLKWKYV